MEIVWLNRALYDIEAIIAYIESENPPGARSVFARIREESSRLAEFPQIGRPGRIGGTRELVIVGTPFIIPYRVVGQRVEILAVMHGARQWPKSF